MQSYKTLLAEVLHSGEERSDRTGTGVRSLFSRSLSADLRQGFPLLTTKSVHFKSVAYELLWFLRADTSARWLEDRNVTIWSEWGDPQTRYMGPIYGVQWRKWRTPDRAEGIDQLQEVIAEIKRNPQSRRLVVSAWNPAELHKMALPPCHAMFQFHVSARGELSCSVFQRSADIFLGVPFNIASYALLTHMVAHICGLGVGAVTIFFGDLHLYANHVEQARELLAREPRDLPVLKIRRPVKDLDSFVYDDFVLGGYTPHPPIKAPVAI